jgi:prepilin-type N-terminal cleavage/methylation domain-containing protein
MIRKKRGFTLLELSIVMTIIALIIGGILLGDGLIRNSELHAIATEQQQYNQAASGFRDKYLALPGDFNGATVLWDVVSGACASTTGSTPEATCDGDANGLIDPVTATNDFEQFRAWQHLVNAKLLAVVVNGLKTATYTRRPGVNLPESKLSGAGWAIAYVTQAAAATDAFATTNDTPFKHVLWFGGVGTASNSNKQNGVLTPTEALQIDQKLDDGSPIAGRVVAQNDATCVISSQYATLSAAGFKCALVFKTGF